MHGIQRAAPSVRLEREDRVAGRLARGLDNECAIHMVDQSGLWNEWAGTACDDGAA